MDNGYQNKSEELKLRKYKQKDSFVDRQNLNSQAGNQYFVQINEANRRQESAIFRQTNQTDNRGVCMLCEHCSNSDRSNFDKENRSWINPREENNFLSVDNDSLRVLRCQKCSNIICNRSEIFVMMKNKSCGNNDVDAVAMETDVIGSSCNGNSAHGNSGNVSNTRLMANENILDHLKGMSLNERRMSVTPRITLTNVDDEGSGQREDEAMITDEDNCSSPLSPRFLTVPKIEELGPERRPPPMVKTM